MKTAADLVPDIESVPTRLRENFPEIQDETFWCLYEACKDYSLCHVTGFYNTYQSLNYIAKDNIGGVLVECGCFLGGMAMFMGLVCRKLGLEREIVVFDTFQGPPVGSTDVTSFGTPIETPSLLPYFRKAVEDRIRSTLGNVSRYRFVEGLVEATLPDADVGPIALLRLDTDFYSSTKIEMETLYPQLVPGGVLIVDDYGLFRGSRRAVDEYFDRHGVVPLLNRIDGGVWSGVKMAPQRTTERPWTPVWLSRLRGLLGHSRSLLG